MVLGIATTFTPSLDAYRESMAAVIVIGTPQSSPDPATTKSG
jgi:hypothetical protein